MEQVGAEAGKGRTSRQSVIAADEWDPLTIDELRTRMDGTGFEWWVAGGVAIDCFLGWVTRCHDDIDVEMFRADSDRLFDVFDGWDLHAVSEGETAMWRRGDQLPDGAFGIWGRPDQQSPWVVEVLLAGGDGHTWRFRRDPTITMPLTRLVRRTETGVPYCTPEVQLLYKSQRARPKDDVDLARCLHRMSTEQRSWLQDALGRLDPSHPWNTVLAAASRLNDESG
jgi:Aminoglycoside-2''-adenylyltransferase